MSGRYICMMALLTNISLRSEAALCEAKTCFIQGLHAKIASFQVNNSLHLSESAHLSMLLHLRNKVTSEIGAFRGNQVNSVLLDEFVMVLELTVTSLR